MSWSYPHPPRGPPGASFPGASFPAWGFAGDGVDHLFAEGAGPSFPPGFPFGPGGFWAGPWGSCGRGRGRHGFRGRGHGGWRHHHQPWGGFGGAAGTYNHENNNNQEQEMPDTAAAGRAGDPEKEGEQLNAQEARDGGADSSNHQHGGHGHGHGHGRGGHHHGPPPPYYGGAGVPGAFDFRGLMASLANHPYAQQLREYIEQAQAQAGNGARSGSDDDDATAFDDTERFAPPVDVFDRADSWIVHVALPGATKEDVGVRWDAESSSLAVSGVVHRPGDEEFQASLVSGERKVGLFSRKIKLPLAGQKDEVNSEGIAARMEDGVLMVAVPKVEKEWTEVKKVEIE